MISITIVLGLAISFVAGVHLERFAERGEEYCDLCDCDHDNWEWDNDDPNIHAIHRDCREDPMITSCYYGEWGIENPQGNPASNMNSWGYTQWAILQNGSPDGFITLDEYPVHIRFRLWAYCDFERRDEIRVIIYDDWQNNGGTVHDPLDDVYGRDTELVSMTRAGGSCDGWTGELDEDNLSFWDEIACTGTGNPSCYYDYDGIFMARGNYIRLRWETDMDEQPDNEQWAFSNLCLCAGPECIEPRCPCCQAPQGSSNAQARQCKVFRESRNCENAGCEWQSDDFRCNYPCCRKIDPASKEKPKCKTLNDNLSRCGNQRDDCYVSTCDCQGFFDNGDAFDIPDGQEVCPPFTADERQCFHEYPVDPQPNVGRDN